MHRTLHSIPIAPIHCGDNCSFSGQEGVDRQKGQELEVIIGYIVSVRLEPVSKTKQKPNRKTRKGI